MDQAPPSTLTRASGDAAAIAATAATERPQDIVDLLNRGRVPLAAAILEALPEPLAVDVLDQPELERAASILSALPPDRAARLLDGMSADRAVDAVREMRLSDRTAVLGMVTRETKASLDRLLPYPEGVTGHIMTTEFVAVPANWTVRQVLDHIRAVENTRETVYAIYVLDPETQELLRAVGLRTLVVSDPDALILDVAQARPPMTVTADTPAAETVRLISKYNLLAIGVVDASRHLIGIVTVDDAVDTLVEQQDAEVHHFGGMEALDVSYTQISFLGMIRKRAGWLCVLFLAEMLTATAMQGFEEDLEKAVVLALFIPLVMSSGGNSGSQATSLIIRALALQEIHLRDWWRVLLRELPSGLTLGAILGVIGALGITIWQVFGIFDYGPHWTLIALTIALALVGIVTTGSLVGSILPFIAKRLGVDPATASAPFVATMVDVTGIVIFFTVAQVILHGTLL